MTGIQYITDEKGRKGWPFKIDLKKHRELWEDIEDVLVSSSRRHEERIPLDRIKAGFIKSGKPSRGWLSRRFTASAEKGRRDAQTDSSILVCS